MQIQIQGDGGGGEFFFEDVLDSAVDLAGLGWLVWYGMYGGCVELSCAIVTDF